MKPTLALPALPPLDLMGVSFDLDRYLRREYSDIGEAAIQLPTIIEMLNYEAQVNREARLCLEAQYERKRAEAYFYLKNGGFQKEGYGEKATEDALKMAIVLQPEIQQLSEELAIRDAREKRLYNLMGTFQAKLELVRSTEATRRKLPDEPR